MSEKKYNRQFKKWTDEERSYLSNKWGSVKISSLCKELGRTQKAIEDQAWSMGLGTQMRWYSSSEIANMLGLGLCTVKRYMDSGKMPHLRDKTKSKRRMASDEQIKQFMRNHQDLWDTRKVTINLYENNPTWYKEKIERDKLKPLRRNSYYTDLEDKILIDRFRRGWSIKEISKEVSRNEKSVDNRLRKLDYGRKLNI